MSKDRKALASPQRLYGLANTPLRAPARLLKSESVAANGLLADVRTLFEFGKMRERTRKIPNGGGTFDWIIEFSVLSIDNTGADPVLVWSSPTELYRVYVRDGVIYETDPDPDDTPAPQKFISLTTAT